MKKFLGSVLVTCFLVTGAVGAAHAAAVTYLHKSARAPGERPRGIRFRSRTSDESGDTLLPLVGHDQSLGRGVPQDLRSVRGQAAGHHETGCRVAARDAPDEPEGVLVGLVGDRTGVDHG